MNILNQKVYTFADADGKQSFNLNKVILKTIVEGIETKAKLEDLFQNKPDKTLNKISGYSVIQYFDIKEGWCEYKNRKITFKDEEGNIYQLIRVANPVIQMNDKKPTDEYISKVNELLNSEEDFGQEEVVENVLSTSGKESLEELADEIEEATEEKVETKFERDAKQFVERGYEIIESDEYKLLLKEGAVPILVKEVNEEHYEEYDFVEKKDDKEYVFRDFNSKKISFILD